jgi:hypothetical protein
MAKFIFAAFLVALSLGEILENAVFFCLVDGWVELVVSASVDWLGAGGSSLVPNRTSHRRRGLTHSTISCSGYYCNLLFLVENDGGANNNNQTSFHH